MLEQERADWLLETRKIYSHTATIELMPGTDVDYQVEDVDGGEFFLLDVRRPRLNKRSVRLQLRYRRSLVLARLCTAVGHTNPDGTELQAPHFHRYREGYEAKWAEQLEPFADIFGAVGFFCKAVNLPVPDIQGGISQ
jgi:hypothetical protein